MSKGTRRRGRELALKIIYGLQDQNAETIDEVLEDFWRSFRFSEDILGVRPPLVIGREIDAPCFLIL